LSENLGEAEVLTQTLALLVEPAKKRVMRSHHSLDNNWTKTPIYGWNKRSGKNRLNSIKIPAVINIQTVNKTGARERYFAIQNSMGNKAWRNLNELLRACCD
jgi:hypothetical protein